MIDLDFTLDAGRTASKFRELQARIKDMRPVWASFLNFYKTDIIPKSFESKGSLMGGRWIGLTDRYRKWKSTTSTNTSSSAGVSLKLTGRLYAAATGGAGWYQKVNKQSVEFGIKKGVIPYANRHQEGNNMPQRPYFYTVDDKLPTRASLFLYNEALKYVKKDL